MINLTSHDSSSFPDVESSTSLPQWLLTPFIIISIIESILGIVGNILVIIVITCIGKSNLSNGSHNFFIVNLALSDLVLCLFTMPLNTYRSLNIYMTFPPAFCKLADSFPAINVCVSSLTIVAISIYRYLVVCYPHKQFNGRFGTFFIMIGIWVLAITAASPLFIYSHSSRVYDDVIIETMVQIICIDSIDDSCKDNYYKTYQRLHVCHEEWPKHRNWHLLYTIFMFFLQFIFPISIICITYSQVMLKLRRRFQYRFLIKRHNIASLRHEIRRQRRNNFLLLLIVSSYAISWLPFNISYTVFTYANQYQSRSDGEKVNDLSNYLPLRFLICMISAITNPFLYGYFNETFKDGLERILLLCCPQMIRDKTNHFYDQTDIPSLETTFQKHQNGGLALRSFVYQLNSQEFLTNTVSIRPSTRLTLTTPNHLLPSISPTN